VMQDCSRHAIQLHIPHTWPSGLCMWEG
jgi:hypothetical protein